MAVGRIEFGPGFKITSTHGYTAWYTVVCIRIHLEWPFEITPDNSATLEPKIKCYQSFRVLWTNKMILPFWPVLGNYFAMFAFFVHMVSYLN